MKAVRIDAFGGPEKVHLENLPPPLMGPGEALVRVKAAGVNPVDWMIREKIYNPEGADKVPLTLGQDFAGIIEKLPPDHPETSLKVGDAVFGETWGSFAEYALVPLKDLVRKPPSIEFTVAASIPMPGLTAWQMVIDTAAASRGMTFLIHGISGGVGSFAAQFAKWKRCHVIGTAGPESFEYLKSIGVDRIIDYHKENFEDLVKDVDVVIDPLGGETQARSWSVLKPEGLLINLTGEIDEAAGKRAGVRTVMFGMDYNTEDLEEIAGLVEQGLVKPHISRVLPLDEARQALEMNQRGASHGKIVLSVA